MCFSDSDLRDTDNINILIILREVVNYFVVFCLKWWELVIMLVKDAKYLATIDSKNHIILFY